MENEQNFWLSWPAFLLPAYFFFFLFSFKQEVFTNAYTKKMQITEKGKNKVHTGPLKLTLCFTPSVTHALIADLCGASVLTIYAINTVTCQQSGWKVHCTCVQRKWNWILLKSVKTNVHLKHKHCSSSRVCPNVCFPLTAQFSKQSQRWFGSLANVSMNCSIC